MDRIDPELLKRYAEGRCTIEERNLVEQWLDEEDNIFANERPLSETPPRTALKKEVWSNLVRHVQARSLWPALRWWGLGIGLATLAIAIIWQFGRPYDQTTPSVTPMLTKEVPSGKQMKILLPDSSLVWLAGGSTFRYPAQFRDSVRELILLSGEAYFEIRTHPQHPLRVITAHSRVEVLGTRFSIRNRNYLSQLFVSLEQGSIRFTDSLGSTYLLSPGEQLAYDKSRQRISEVTPVSAQQLAGWRNGTLWFKATPMPEALKVLEEYYGVTFQTAGHPKLDIPLTGKFDKLPLPRVLQLLEQSTALHFIPTGKTIIIK